MNWNIKEYLKKNLQFQLMKVITLCNHGLTEIDIPNVEQAVRIAKVLNTTVEFLTLGKDEKQKQDNEETIKLLELAIKKLS